MTGNPTNGDEPSVQWACLRLLEEDRAKAVQCPSIGFEVDFVTGDGLSIRRILDTRSHQKPLSRNHCANTIARLVDSFRLAEREPTASV